MGAWRKIGLIYISVISYFVIYNCGKKLYLWGPDGQTFLISRMIASNGSLADIFCMYSSIISTTVVLKVLALGVLCSLTLEQ